MNISPMTVCLSSFLQPNFYTYALSIGPPVSLFSLLSACRSHRFRHTGPCRLPCESESETPLHHFHSFPTPAPAVIISILPNQHPVCTLHMWSSLILTLRRPSTTTAKLSDRSFHHFTRRLWETLPSSLQLLNTPNISTSPSFLWPFPQPVPVWTKNSCLQTMVPSVASSTFPA